MKTSTKTLNAKIDQSRRRQARYKPLNRQEAHNSPAKTKGYFDELSFERLKIIIEQREEIAKLKAEIKESNEHIETLANKLLDSK